MLLVFCILTTHFHVIVRSRTGELDRVMQRVQNTYVRYFNRTCRRDGPLFRGRYRAKRVGSACGGVSSMELAGETHGLSCASVCCGISRA